MNVKERVKGFPQLNEELAGMLGELKPAADSTENEFLNLLRNAESIESARAIIDACGAEVVSEHKSQAVSGGTIVNLTVDRAGFRYIFADGRNYGPKCRGWSHTHKWKANK